MKKINRCKGVIGILLSVCVMIQMMPSKYSVQAAGDQSWLTCSDSVYTSTIGTVTDNGDGSVTLNAKAAAYYKEKITVNEGTEISLNVTIPTVVDGYDVVYGFALTDNVDSYYRSTEASGYSVAAEFLGGKTADKLVAMGVMSKGGTRTVLTPQKQVTSGRADIVDKTYTVTITRQASTSECSWIMTVTEQGGTTATMEIKASDFAHDQLGNEVYLIVGSGGVGAHEAKISNMTVKQAESGSNNGDGTGTSTENGTTGTGTNTENGTTGTGTNTGTTSGTQNTVVETTSWKDYTSSNIEPSYLVDEMEITDMQTEVLIYILSGAAGITLIISVVIFIKEIKKGKKSKVLTEN